MYVRGRNNLGGHEKRARVARGDSGEQLYLFYNLQKTQNNENQASFADKLKPLLPHTENLERFWLVAWNSRAASRNGARTTANQKRRYVKSTLHYFLFRFKTLAI